MYFTKEQSRPLLPYFEREDYYEDFGFAVVAQTDEHDLYIWEAIYIKQGGPHRPASQWLGDGVVENTMLIIAPKSWRRQGMHDNNFFRTGISTSQYHPHGDLKITEDAHSVSRQIANMRVTCRLEEGIHHVRGEHAGAELDLTFVQLPDSPVVPLFGGFENVQASGLAGGYTYSVCNGTLKIGGKTYEIRDADGLHEHIAISQSPEWDMAVVGPKRDRKGGGVYGTWRIGAHAFQVHSETPDHSTVAVVSPSSHAVFPPDQTKLEITGNWIDPRIGVSVPCRWKIQSQGPGGKIEVDIEGYARGNWPWEMKRAIMLEELILVTANGTYTDAAGTTIKIEEAIGIMDYQRMIMLHTETLDGPDLTPTW